MSPRAARAKVADNRANQVHAAVLSSRERLARAVGPQVFYARAPQTGEDLLFVRPDLVALTKHKEWPQPLTAMARTLIYEGDRTLRETDKLERYLELQHLIIVELARVEPQELIAAREADRLEHEGLVAAWEASDKKGKRPEDSRRSQLAVMRELDVTALKPLFVMPGQEPDDDQLVLLVPGDNLPVSSDGAAVRFTIQDMLALTAEVLTNQAGTLARFRV